MGENQRSTRDQVKKICAIIKERDNIILETDVKIKYYKDAIEAAERETKELEKARKRIADDEQQVDKQLNQLKMIENSVKESQEIANQTLISHRLLEEMMDKELDTKQQETKQITEEFRNIYSEAKAQLTEHPLYKELEEARVAFLKVDIQRRDLEVKIRTKKRITAQRSEIQKKIFYNFFVQMAEDYLTEKKLTELQRLKMTELEAIKKLYVVQEEVKMRQKLGTPRDKFRNMTNLIFGSQDSHTEKPVNKPATEPPQPKKPPQSLNEKLNDMFERDEAKQSDAPKKVRVIEHKVVVPSFVEPQFPAPEKRKARMVNLSRKWQKMIKSSNSKEVLSLSQQSDKASDQMSQQSQLSQKSQGGQACTAVEASIDNKFMESPMEATGVGRYSQESEASSIQQSCEREPVRYQMMEGSGNSVESMMRDTAGASQPILTDQPLLTNGSAKTQLTMSHPESILSKSHSKQEVNPKVRFEEPVKTVRFNLESGYQPKGSKAAFGHSIFGNPFQSFFGGVPAENTRKASEPAGNLSSSFNMSMMDPAGGNDNTGIDYDAGGNESNMRSPEFSYGIEGEEEQPFKTPDLPPFGGGGGGGGFFSFGTKSMFPFQ